MTKVSAVIVTRGDVVLDEVLDSLPDEWEVLVWDNGGKLLYTWNQKPGDTEALDVDGDLGVYGRYAAIEHAAGDVIYVQDDDVVVSDPQAIVDAWFADAEEMRERVADPARGVDGITDHLVANMPAEFRHDFYVDHCLVGFGAAFHRDAPAAAWQRMRRSYHQLGERLFYRTCDVVFTALTDRRVLVDVPKRDLPYASDPGRMWKQPGHHGERKQVLDLALRVRTR